MATTFWKKISNLGITDTVSSSDKRNYILSNKMNFLLLLGAVLLTLTTSIFRIIHGNEFSIHTKKILVVALLGLINLYLAYKKQHNIVRFNLIVFPLFITISGPILMGYIQEMDVFIAPMAIICLSLIPITILFPDFNKWPFKLSFLYFFIHVFFLDNAINYFSHNSIVVFEYIPFFQFYFKIVFLTVFLFIYMVLYYYRRQNFYYEEEVNAINSELKNNIEELKATQEQLIQTEKMASLGILTAGVAHEINNPLNFIMGAYEGMRMHYEETTTCEYHENVGVLLKNLKAGVDKAANIVKGLRQFSRDNHTFDEECNIPDIIDNCLTMLNNQLKYRVNINKNYTNELTIIKGNVGKLHQVFINLLANASDAITEKGEIEIQTRKNNDDFIIEITDNGEGIKKENLKKIFDPFYTTKKPGQGTGLGLSITYNIIREHDGTLTFESEPEKGTKVKISLPIHNHNKI